MPAPDQIASRLGLAVLLALGSTLYSGMPLHPSAPRGLNAFLVVWISHLLQYGLPLVALTLWADAAVARGRRPLLVYGGVLLGALILGGLVVAPVIDLLRHGNLGLDPASKSGEFMKLFFPLALGLAGYAQWRQAQRSAQRLRAWQGEALQARSELQTARLQALQARVEPQQLVASLRDIAALASRDALAADTELVVLIAQLRTKLDDRTQSPDCRG